MDILEGVLKTVATILVTIVILCWPTMALWNWLMPVLFGLPTITFAQAAGLLGLCYLLFNA